MKKIMLTVAAFFVAFAFLITGCGGTYTPPSGSNGGDNPPPVGPANPSEPQSGDFTVRLLNQNGTQYTDTAGMSVIWSDGSTQPVTAEFGEDGIARAVGLDGDYRITVAGLSKRYAYDPNGYVATNYARNVDVTVYRITEAESLIVPGQSGKTLNGAIELKREGAYSVTLDSASTEMYFLYEPKTAGMYEVRSIINIDDNNINPQYRECFGMSAGMRYTGDKIDGGGAAGTYTVNFVYEKGFNYDEIGNVLMFGVAAELRTGEYPLSFSFLLRRTGDYRRNDINSTMILPAEFADVQSGKKTKEEFINEKTEFIAKTSGGMNNFVNVYADTDGLLNGDNIKFDEESGYYRFYDEEKGLFGKVVCAKITANVEVLGDGGDSFVAVEWHGNNALTVDDNYDWNYKKTTPKYKDRDPHYINYKVFIEGYEGIVRHENGLDIRGLREQYAEYEGVLGYQDMAINGVYPVNEELKRFLQGYATQARLFRDGQGFAENILRSAEEDQWLFACGYFV